MNRSHEIKTKICTKCLNAQPLTEFFREKKARDGLRSDCKICSANRRRKHLGQLSQAERVRRTAQRREKHAEAERQYSKHRRQKYRASELIRLARLRAKKKGLDFDLDDHIQQITERVERNVCEVTGITLQRTAPKAYNSPSLDRINPAAGYIYSNVRVVCYALNCALGTWGKEPLMEILRALEKRAG